MIGGIVLAGGRSERMGRPKALLKVGNATFLERAIQTLLSGGCEDVVVVLNTEDRTISELTAGAGGRSTAGGGAETQQIDSLRAGLRALPPETRAAVVLPVDHPLVEAATVQELIGAFNRRGAAIVLPTHRGRRGHPVLFGAELFGELLDADLAEGARSVIRGHAADVEEVQVADGGVLVDVDTPDAYRSHLGEVE